MKSDALHLIRFQDAQGRARLGLQQASDLYDLTDALGSLTQWLQNSVGQVEASIEALGRSLESAPRAALEGIRALPPIEDQDVWAAGVTYARSKSARQEEAVDGGDVYARVYAAERPEIFFKARGSRVVGDGAAVGIRRDATWNVPEPELALLLNPALEVVGLSIGNDMSSRDIEGANPLYLPQAKLYQASCALGPAILLGNHQHWPAMEISLHIQRAGRLAFEGHIHTDQIHRRLDELVGYLGRSQQFPEGVVLLTGTGIVPPPEFTLQAGDHIRIQIEGIGGLENIVQVV